jgi:hypothetical protein
MVCHICSWRCSFFHTKGEVGLGIILAEGVILWLALTIDFSFSKALVDQLKDGGRMIIPVGPEHGNQELVQVDKHGN